jgi:hypothetical protein
MPLNYFYPYTEAARAEEAIPSMTYAALVENLTQLTDLGVLGTDNPITMLVAARIVDRARIERSGISAAELLGALGEYRVHPKAVEGIVKALELAVTYTDC